MTDVMVTEVHFDGSDVQALLADWNDELGFTPTGGSTVEASDFTPPDGVFLLGRSAKSPVGCGGLRRLTPATGEIKRVYVPQTARAHGPIADYNGNPYARYWFARRL